MSPEDDAHLTYERTWEARTDAPTDPACDREWDRFLESVSTWSVCPQTSGWARARAAIGWAPSRTVIRENGEIVAGVSMLARPIPFGGRIGVVCRGPVARCEGTHHVRIVVEEMMAIGRSIGVSYLVVQPPRGCFAIGETLDSLGFRDGPFSIDSTATVRIDLSKDLERLFVELSTACRDRIRLAQSAGVVVRRGTGDDIPLFNKLKCVHCARLGQARPSPRYYQSLWDALAPTGNLQLFVAERNGTPLAALLALPFGSECYHMDRVWCDECGGSGVGEALEWEVIQWAKTRGYRTSDLDGIARAVGERLLAGEVMPNGYGDDESLFKVGFGGQVVVDPPAYHHVYNPALGLLFRSVPKRLMQSGPMRHAVLRLRATQQ